MRHITGVIMATSALSMGGCVQATAPVADPEEPFEPVYRGIETRLLDDDLVGFTVEMEGARTGQDVADYAECAAAQYTLVRGYGFTRHVRTNMVEEAGVWRADAIYTISPALPRGVSTIDAEVTVSNCDATGIPTV